MGFLGTRIWVAAVAALGLVVPLACKHSGPESATGASQVAGIGQDLRRLLRPERPKSAADLAKSFSRLAADAAKAWGAGGGAMSRAQLQASLFSEIINQGGIPPEQVYQLLADLVAAPASSCGGVSCARAFGLTEAGINAFLDDLLAVVRRQPPPTSPAAAERRYMLEASLKAEDAEAFGRKVDGWLAEAGRAKVGGQVGTCTTSAAEAYGRRGGLLSNAAERLGQWLSGRIDYSLGLPVPNQGHTGACHVFALVDLLRHSRGKGLELVRKIDTRRLFLELWARRLGASVDEAVANEVQTVRMLEIMTSRGVAEQLRTGVDQVKAFNRFVAESRSYFRFYPQGGRGTADFEYLKQEGAILEHEPAANVTQDELEAMGEELGLARLRLIERKLFGGSARIEQADIEQLVRPILNKILSRAAEGGSVDLRPWRRAVARELEGWQLVRQDFAPSATGDEVKRFLQDLRSRGPLYVETPNHASLVIGYDDHVFLLRDSADQSERERWPVDESRFFSRIRGYAYLKRP